MLCPEVWDFSPPPFLFSSAFCESDNDIFQAIKTHYFNHHVSITLPNTLQMPEDLINKFLEDSQYYKISKVAAAEFLERDFVNLFVGNGELTALSLDSFVNKNNQLVFTPSGHLVLSLTRKTYQELEFFSNITKHSKCLGKEFILTLDVAHENGQCKKNLRNKIKSLSKLYFDIILAWEPNVTEICPSSIALYFSKKGFIVKTCDIQYNHKHVYNISAPALDECDVGDLNEWLGAFSLQCNMHQDNYISTMKYTERQENFGQVIFLSFTGLVSSRKIKEAILLIKQSLIKSSSSWISFFVQGFEDNIIKSEKSNFLLVDGNQHYTMFFKHNRPTLFCSFQEFPKEK